MEHSEARQIAAVGSVFQDPRIDKVVSWLLVCFCGVALSFGAYFFQGMIDRIDHLERALNKLVVRVELNAQLERRVSRLEDHVDRLRNEK